MKAKIFKLSMMALGLALPASIQAQTSINPTNPADAQKTQLGNDEKSVLNDIHQTNQMEIDMAQLAQERAQSDEVKSFAKQMIDDHREAQNRLQSVAQDQQYTIASSSATNKADKDTMQRLKKLSGADFDREYMRAQVAAHEKAITRLETAQTQLISSPVSSVIDEILPVIRGHYDMAKDIANRLGYETNPS